MLLFLSMDRVIEGDNTMFLIIDVLIKTVCYIGFFIGLWLLVSPLIIPMVKKQIQLNRYKNDLKIQSNRPIENKLIAHIRLLIYTVYSTKSYFPVFLFFMITVILFTITFSVVFKMINGMLFQLLFSVFIASLPYALLRVKLISIQVDSSYEAESLITKITNQYKINSRNMIIAIDKTIPELSDSPYSRKLLFKLSLGIKEYGNSEELKYLIYEFKYGIGTEWANMLGTSLFFSIHDGLDVTTSLNDTQNRLKIIKESHEKSKRDNHEAFALIKFIIPVLYLSFVLIAHKSFGFSLEKFFNYQFRTSLGIKAGAIVFGTMIINYVLYLVFRKPKYDF
jgi:hypothetical protein